MPAICNQLCEHHSTIGNLRGFRRKPIGDAESREQLADVGAGSALTVKHRVGLEQCARERLGAADVGHAVPSANGNPHADHIWIIDPLDGTTNFIHGFPVYCVSIALQVRGRIEQAVVYDPTRNDLFTATRGRGAFLNDRRLRVSKRIRLKECLIATGFPFRDGDDFLAYLSMMSEIMPRTAGLRRPGAAALDMAYVAAGFSDGFFETGLHPWDMAAGALLVTEAGGLVGNFTGEADFLHQRECLAASPKIYAQLVTLLQPFSKFASVTQKAPASQTMADLDRALDAQK